MTVMSAPRMTPRMVSSLIWPVAFNTLSCGISFPLEIWAIAGRGRRRVTPDRLPPAIGFHPHVSQKHAILDYPAKISDPPARVDGANHDVVEHRRVLHRKLNGVDLAALNCVEPFVPVHHEWTRRAGADEDEVRMHQRAQAIHVFPAQGIAPIGFESLD